MTKTIRSIKLPDNYFSVLKELAALHGQSIQDYCSHTVQFVIEDTVENYPEEIGRLVCNPWKKALSKGTDEKKVEKKA